jgi:hypothetical protein
LSGLPGIESTTGILYIDFHGSTLKAARKLLATLNGQSKGIQQDSQDGQDGQDRKKEKDIFPILFILLILVRSKNPH